MATPGEKQIGNAYETDHINNLFYFVFLGAKSTSILDCVGWLVGWSVGRSVPTMRDYVEK
jgi:hypothetical protein